MPQITMIDDVWDGPTLLAKNSSPVVSTELADQLVGAGKAVDASGYRGARVDSTESTQASYLRRGDVTAMRTAAIGGSSQMQNNVTYFLNAGIRTGAFYWAEGRFNWANAILGQRMRVLGMFGQGGRTLEQFRTEQLAAMMATGAEWLHFDSPTNDIFSEGVTSITTLRDRLTRLIDTPLQAGRKVSVTTVPARATSSFNQAFQTALLRYNDVAHEVCAARKALLHDVNILTTDPTSTQRVPRPGYNYDSPAVHWNNAMGYLLGKDFAALLNPYFRDAGYLNAGAADYTNYGSSVGGNVLDNVVFSGSGGTAGANVSGTIPTGWTVQWAVRTGTATATVGVVDVTDPITGLVVGKGLQVAISAGAAAADRLDIFSADLAARVPAGSIISGRARVILSASPAGVDEIRIFAKGNSSSGYGEGTWWGAAQNTAVVLPEGFDVVAEAPEVTVVGTVSAGTNARFESRIRFASSGAATVTLAQPQYNVR